mgnify:CR=1 FL=1
MLLWTGQELVSVALTDDREGSFAARLVQIGKLIVASVLTILARIDDDDGWVGALPI